MAVVSLRLVETASQFGITETKIRCIMETEEEFVSAQRKKVIQLRIIATQCFCSVDPAKMSDGRNMGSS